MKKWSRSTNISDVWDNLSLCTVNAMLILEYDRTYIGSRKRALSTPRISSAYKSVKSRVRCYTRKIGLEVIMLPHRAARDCNALTRNELKNSQDDLPENKRSTNGALNFCLTYYLPQNIKRTKRAEICKLRFQVTRSTIRNSITQ